MPQIKSGCLGEAKPPTEKTVYSLSQTPKTKTINSCIVIRGETIASL